MKANPERRRYPRVELPKGTLVAWETGGGQRVVCGVGGLSLGGLFISTPEPLPVGSIVKLLFELPEGDIRARGEVRHVQPGQGMGVRFTFMGYEDRARLRHLLNRLMC